MAIKTTAILIRVDAIQNDRKEKPRVRVTHPMQKAETNILRQSMEKAAARRIHHLCWPVLRMACQSKKTKEALVARWCCHFLPSHGGSKRVRTGCGGSSSMTTANNNMKRAATYSPQEKMEEAT
mmetsp:Transcript_14068/g.25216  ORF Transcript_14068/g.25216 Transcript_14068/m.25216 type:complete len:124 (-) Transcript_14068:381-752(-)